MSTFNWENGGSENTLASAGFLRADQGFAEPDEPVEMVEDENEAELVEESEGGGCFSRGCLTLVVILLLLLLLLLFIPAKRPSKQVEKPTAILKPEHGYGVTGQVGYTIVSSKRVFKIASTDAGPKEVFAVVRLSVKNLAPYTQSFDYSMVQLSDNGGRLYDPYVNGTLANGSSWPKKLAPNQSKTATVVFSVERASTDFSLVGHDLDWRNLDVTTVTVGTPPISGKPFWNFGGVYK